MFCLDWITLNNRKLPSYLTDNYQYWSHYWIKKILQKWLDNAVIYIVIYNVIYIVSTSVQLTG